MFPRALALLLLASAASAQEIAEEFARREREAFAHYERKEYAAAIAGFERQIACFAENPAPYYNIACCWALQGDAERAAVWLGIAVLRGWRDVAHTEQDPDFAAVREAPAFRAALEDLRFAAAQDPEPLPRELEFAAAPPARAYAEIERAFEPEEARLRRVEALLEEGQLRRQRFPLLDRKSAALGRYLVENGDARDAHLAAYARVEAAWRYLEHAREGERDARLREVAAQLVLRRAAEFERGWAGSPYFPDVLHARVLALRRAGELSAEAAVPEWRRIAADFPESPAAWRALVELCADAAERGDREAIRRDLATLRLRWGADPEASAQVRGRLFKARLLAEGLPAVEGRQPPEDAKAVLYVVVSPGHRGSEEKLALARRLLDAYGGQGFAVVVVAPSPAETWAAWLAEHGGPAARGFSIALERLAELGVTRFPTLVLARGREVLAVDPADDELTRSVAEACR
jgi:hypothetical protein